MIPAVNQKGVGGGVASLNGIGKLEQMPTPADLGIVSYITEWNGNKNGFYVKLSNGYMVCFGKLSRPDVELEPLSANDNFIIGYATVAYPMAFSGTPTVMFTTTSSGYVESSLGGINTANFQARFTSIAGTQPTGITIHYLAIGPWE